MSFSVRECDAVLVVGSSLYVWSGFRFVREAISCQKEVLVVNIGDTRADAFAEKMKLDKNQYRRLQARV